jgi:hypothetical protein
MVRSKESGGWEGRGVRLKGKLKTQKADSVWPPNNANGTNLILRWKSIINSYPSRELSPVQDYFLHDKLER